MRTPDSTEAVAAIVSRARRDGRRVRVIGRQHTSNAAICPDSTRGIAISTAKLAQPQAIEWFEGVETVLTEPGVRYGDLTRWLDERGRSLGFAVLGTRDPTIAGAIATGSHGSSPTHASVLSNRVEWVEIVDSNGQVQAYSRRTTAPDVWKTLTASMGMAGVVTKLRLRVEPTFSLDVQVDTLHDRVLERGEGPIETVKGCDFGQLVWFPGQRRVIRMCGRKTTLPRQNGATSKLLEPDFSAWVQGPAERALHYGTCNQRFNCKTLERMRYLQFKRTPPFSWSPRINTLRSSPTLVGAGYAMMSSEFTTTATGILQHDFEFAIPPARAADAFADARSYFEKHDICLPMVGVFIRFSRIEEHTWISHTTRGKDFPVGDYVTFFEMPIYVPQGASPQHLRAYMSPIRGWVEQLIRNYGARPHWAKNDDWVFELQDTDLAYGNRMHMFRRVVRKLDPEGVFSNDWSRTRGLR